ncbi:MAG: hypothetical protein E7528_05130 [Ruminococcaceae bacterium]|nr:hypothetical protein [Oscillospiraceae bacterium]
MINRIEKVFSEVTGRDDLNFTEKTRLDKNFDFTSLSFIQLICGLEDEFDIDIPNSMVKKIKTVGDIVKFLEKNM